MRKRILAAALALMLLSSAAYAAEGDEQEQEEAPGLQVVLKDPEEEREGGNPANWNGTSPAITNKDQTIKETDDGEHTISGQFQPDTPKNPVKPTASHKDVEVTPKQPEQPKTPKPSNSGKTPNTTAQKPSSPAPAASSAPTALQTVTGPAPTVSAETTASTALSRFADVPAGSTFYQDIEWACERGLMTGFSDGSFGPKEELSYGAILAVLSRFSGEDLEPFSQLHADGIPQNTWYSTSANWAAQAGLLPDNLVFRGDLPLDRDSMAVILVRYLAYQGILFAPPEVPVLFTDAAQMSEEGYDAFQILYHYGIFKGTGSARMNPAASITRAQFAVLLHRISNLVEL